MKIQLVVEYNLTGRDDITPDFAMNLIERMLWRSRELFVDGASIQGRIKGVNKAWVKAATSDHYTYWTYVDENMKIVYNCTGGDEPPNGWGGYHNLDAIRRLKNDTTPLKLCTG